MNEEFMVRVFDALIRMRLLVEGASSFYEEAQPLYGLGKRNDMRQEAEAFDFVASALRELKKEINTLQEECRKQGEQDA